MNIESIHADRADVQKLLLAANPDAALLYIYLKSGNPMIGAEEALKLSATRVSCAGATLRQLGLWSEEKSAHIPAGERPSYSERDVLEASDTDVSFRSLCGEVQRVLGRNLNTEELKILLGFVRYLGLPGEVISVLVCYCRDRARQKSGRNPSLRAIEKEAYFWAEHDIDTLEEAAAFIHSRNLRETRISRLMHQLQIRGRSLTAAEERYAQSWIEMGFDEESIAMAYERTCLNTGGLNWSYMNRIMERWHGQGLHTAEAIRTGDKKNQNGSGPRQLDDDEKLAIRRMMEGN